jgi:hypothetical protein
MAEIHRKKSVSITYESFEWGVIFWVWLGNRGELFDHNILISNIRGLAVIVC